MKNKDKNFKVFVEVLDELDYDQLCLVAAQALLRANEKLTEARIKAMSESRIKASGKA